MTLETEQRHDGIWITGMPPEDGPVGPYATQREAEETRVRLSRFYRFADRPGYITSDPSPRNT